jgi:hypothetical protein
MKEDIVDIIKIMIPIRSDSIVSSKKLEVNVVTAKNILKEMANIKFGITACFVSI